MSTWKLFIMIEHESSVSAETRTYDNQEDIKRYINKIKSNNPNKKITFTIKPNDDDNSINGMRCT